jgi:hypothetical protein
MAAFVIGSTLVMSGTMSYYAPNVMTEVYGNRLAWGHVQPCPECIGMVALADARHLGKRVWLDGPQGLEGPFLTTDCGKFLTPGRILEVDWQTARRWGMRGPLPVTVFVPPATAPAVQ